MFVTIPSVLHPASIANFSKVEQVAQAMRTAGLRGSSAIAGFTGVAKEALGGPEFTAVNNAGCLALAKDSKGN